jgi:hypothetical protein
MSPPKKKRPLASKALDSAESGAASPRSDGRSNSIVEQLRDLLGSDVVLLPIKRGHKGCLEMKWEDDTPSPQRICSSRSI